MILMKSIEKNKSNKKRIYARKATKSNDGKIKPKIKVFNPNEKRVYKIKIEISPED